MAVTAKFVADFTSFNAAVQKAEVELKSFASGASKVEAGLKRMGNAFSGQRIIQDATLMASAIERAGGASKLTASELQRVGATAQEAIAKMKALGVEVPANIQKLADATKGATGAFGGLGAKLTSINGLLGGLGISLSIGAVVSAGKAVLSYADSLTKLADKTGISTAALQRLQAVAGASGNSIEDVANAVTQFQRRLGSGDTGATKAIESLGLSLERIKQLSPDEQFFALAKALQGVKDPAEQVAKAMELFGRSGAEVLPTIKADIDKLKDSTFQMSETSVQALDDFGDKMSAFGTSALNVLGEVAGAALTLTERVLALGGALPKAASNAGQLIPGSTVITLERASTAAAAFTGEVTFMGKVVKASTVGLVQGFAAGSDAVDDIHQAFKSFREQEVQKLNAELKTFNANTRDVIQTAQGFRVVVDSVDGSIVEAIKFYREAGVGLDRLATMYGLTRVQVDALTAAEKNEAAVLQFRARVSAEATKGGDALLAQLRAQNNELAASPIRKFTIDLSHLGKGLQNAVQHARSLTDSLTSLAHLDLKAVFGDVGGFFKNGLGDIGKGILQGFGQGILSGITSLISKGLGLLAKGIGQLFGNTAEKQVNPIRQAFVDAAGGLAELNQKAKEAGVTLKALLDAKNPEAYKKAIDDLNAALQFQDNAMAKLDETVKKYGFSLSELGPALQRQNLDRMAGDLFQDFKVLTGAGINVDTVLGKMGDSINSFIHDALRTGTEIPAALSPVLQRMVELGQLTDENGNIITDLEASGVHFAETMTQGFQKIVDAVTKLTDAISRGLGLAIANIPDPEVTGRVRWNVDQIPGANDYTNDFPAYPAPIPMASGGFGTVTKPTLFMAGEAGREQYAFSGAGKTFGSGAAPTTDAPSRTQVIVQIGDRQLGDFVLEDIMAGGKSYGKFRTLVKAVS